MTPLHLATEKGQKNTVRELIKMGVNVNVADNHGNTALSFAFLNKREAIAIQLISQGAYTNMSNEHGDTAVHFAAKGGCSHRIHDLVKAGAKADTFDLYGDTPLLIAAEKGNTETVCALSGVGASVNTHNRQGETALHLAAKRKDHTDMVCALFSAGASVNTHNRQGETALHLAAKKDHTDTVCALFSAGASVNTRNREGETALHLAAKRGYIRTVCALLSVGVKVDARNLDGKTACDLATENGHITMADKLVNFRANLKAHTLMEDTTGTLVLEDGLAETGDDVGKEVVNLEAFDWHGNTPLHQAVLHHKLKKIASLIRAGANVQSVNRLGESALIIAARRGFNSAAKVLLEAGADVEVRDNVSNTALSRAAQTGNGRLCCELVSYGAKVDDTISFFESFRTAIESGDVQLLSDLVKIVGSVNVRSPDKSAWTPLHVAAKPNLSVSWQTRAEIIKMLLPKGADPTAVTCDTLTPLDIAKQQKHYSAVKILERAELEHQLMKVGGEARVPDSITIRFGGPPGAGKTTLTQALQVTRMRSYFRYESQADQGATDMRQRTKGINCQTFVDEKEAQFMIFDLGGHGEFLATHQMFIGDGSVPVIDCVVVSALDVKMKDNVLKWCSLFASRNQPVATPWPLLLIATRADTATDQQTHAVTSVYHELKQTFSKHFRFPCNEPFFIDARKSWGEPTVGLRQMLNQLHRELVNDEDSPRQPAVCRIIVESLPALRKTTSSPVILKERFIEFMLPRIGFREETEVYSAQIATLFDNALKYLSGYATVLSFSQPLVQRYVVINPGWLLSDIVGRLMAEPPLPGPYICYDNGYARTCDAIAALETEFLPGREALEMVAGLGFCLEQSTAETVLNPSKLRGRRLEKHWCRTSAMPVNAGRRLKCKGTVAITSAFFPHLQVHFYHRYLSDYNQKLPMWMGGIRLVPAQRVRSSVEALIESDASNFSIDIIVRGKEDSEEECSELLHSLTEETLQKAVEISPGSQLRLFFLSKLELDQLSPTGLPSRPLVEYSEERVLRAISRGEYLSDCEASTPENPQDLLLPRQLHQRSTLHDELKSESATPPTQSVSTEDWRVVLLRVAGAVNRYDECRGLAEALALNGRGEDIVERLLQPDPRRLPPDIAFSLFETWLKRGASQLSTEQRRRKLTSVFRVDLRRSILSDILNDELRALCSGDEPDQVQ